MDVELKKRVLAKFNEYCVSSLRLTMFGAELDNKMRSQMRKDQKEDPTNLTYTYLYQLRKDIIEIFKEDEEGRGE